MTDVSAPNKVCSISEYDAVSVLVPEELRLKLEASAIFELAPGVVVLNAPLVEFVVWPLVRVAAEIDSTD